MIDIKARVERLFFDNEKVIKALDKAKRKSLSKAGAFVRRRAQTSIRKSKRVSDPNNPPHSHIGLLRKHIYFAYEPDTGRVFVGPIALKKKEAPSLLEYGGIRVTDRGRQLRYQKRPFMRPALEQEKKVNPSLFFGDSFNDHS
jgi:hypothetical protein